MATAAAIPATVWVGVRIQLPNANPDAVEISLSAEQEVQWYSDTACIVKFPKGSPFNETEFHVPAHGSVCSGPVVKKAKVCTKPAGTCASITHEGHYKYTITDSHGKVLADPQVVIKP